MATPQTNYSGGISTPNSKATVYWDGAGTLATGSVVCYDLSVADGKTVTKPVTADLAAPAGVYVGTQGGSITEAGNITIVPFGKGTYGEVVEVLAADDVYAVNDAIGLTNDSFSAIIVQVSAADGEGHAEGLTIDGYFGLCLTAGTNPGTIKVLLTK